MAHGKRSGFFSVCDQQMPPHSLGDPARLGKLVTHSRITDTSPADCVRREGGMGQQGTPSHLGIFMLEKTLTGAAAAKCSSPWRATPTVMLMNDLAWCSRERAT